MTNKLEALAIIFLLLIIFIVTIFVKKDKILVKYAIIWYLLCLLLILFVMFPSVLSLVTNWAGIQVASNMIFALLISLLFAITISLTIIVSSQKEQIRTLIQEISLLKEKTNGKK